MKWSKEAQKAISRVPFFVRNRVKKYVESEARKAGASQVEMVHVKACQDRFLKNGTQPDIKGYQVETCFGHGGCPNRAVEPSDLPERIESLVKAKNLLGLLKERVKGPLKMHHEFRISISECPNSCSRPQIVDFGLIGATRPQLADSKCKDCGACTEVCKEEAIEILKGVVCRPLIHEERCLGCGQCIKICPTGALIPGETGYRIQVGGKLGRHPQLATELPGIYSPHQVLSVLERCLDLYQVHSQSGERFGEILNRIGLQPILQGISPE